MMVIVIISLHTPAPEQPYLNNHYVTRIDPWRRIMRQTTNTADSQPIQRSLPLVIIFDWGGTLWDQQVGQLYPETFTTVSILALRHRLHLVSSIRSVPCVERLAEIYSTGLADYFNSIRVVAEDKDAAFDASLGLCAPSNVAVVDDHVFRGIRWGNRRGIATIWMRQGLRRDVTPTSTTGQPTIIINKITELLRLSPEAQRFNPWS
jgi:hypothetical protein